MIDPYPVRACLFCFGEYPDTAVCFEITLSGELDTLCKRCRAQSERNKKKGEVAQFEKERRKIEHQIQQHKHARGLKRYCGKMGFDFEYISQKIADINQVCHDYLMPKTED